MSSCSKARKKTGGKKQGKNKGNTGVGIDVPFWDLFDITFKYLLEIISPIVGWCLAGTFTNKGNRKHRKEDNFARRMRREDHPNWKSRVCLAGCFLCDEQTLKFGIHKTFSLAICRCLKTSTWAVSWLSFGNMFFAWFPASFDQRPWPRWFRVFFLASQIRTAWIQAVFSRRPGAEVLVLYEIVWWW